MKPTPDTRFAPGSGLGMVTAGRWLLCTGARDGFDYERVWSAMLAGAPLNDLRAVVGETIGAGHMGAAILHSIDKTACLSLLGSASARIEHRLLDAGKAPSWLDYEVSLGTPIQLTLTGEMAPTSPYRVTEGIFPADAMTIHVPGPNVIREAPTPEMRSNTAPTGPAGQLVDADVLAGAGASPLVSARACRYGHLNAPHSFECRICGTSPLQEAVESVRRPTLGTLHFSTGQTVPVDRPVFVGRSPSAPHRGNQIPALITVPGMDISRTHVEVRPEDWTVLVIDLNSSNGTSVTLPGKRPQRLRPTEPMQVVPGTSVVLSESVSFVFEVST